MKLTLSKEECERMAARELTRSMLDAMLGAPITGHPETGTATFADLYAAALAAAPEFEAPEVSDMACECIWANLGDYVFASPARQGRAMIAAVQQVLGPMLGLVPKEWVRDAFLEGGKYAPGDSFPSGVNAYAKSDWARSQARKRIEGEGRG